MQYFVSFLVLQSPPRKRELVVLLGLCSCCCVGVGTSSVSFPHGAMCWSVIVAFPGEVCSGSGLVARPLLIGSGYVPGLDYVYISNQVDRKGTC